MLVWLGKRSRNAEILVHPESKSSWRKSKDALIKLGVERPAIYIWVEH